MGATEVLRLDQQAVTIDQSQVLRLIGYPPGAPINPTVREALPRVIRTVRALAEPGALYCLHAVAAVSRDTVQLHGGVTFRGQRLALALRAAQQAAVFVLTLGPRVSDAVRETADADPFESFLIDGVASIMAEAVADELQARLEERMNQQGAWGGWRFSPGYCDWPIEENQILLPTIDAQRIGVRLTTGGMMAPRKSISGIIGFGADAAKLKINPCVGCPRTECDHRRQERRSEMDSRTSAS